MAKPLPFHRTSSSSPEGDRRRLRSAALVSALLLALALVPARAAEPRASGAALSASAPSASVAPASALPIATAARLETHGDTTRLVFDVTAGVSGVATPLVQPARIVVDLPEVNFQVDPEVGRPRPATRSGVRGRKAEAAVPLPLAGLVRAFRFGLFAPGRSRIVIDLAEPARVVRAAMEQTGPGAGRFTIDLARTDRAAFAAAAQAALRAEAVPAAPIRAEGPAADAKPLVVLDAGHGGVDTGALGATGIVEKEITFAFAKALEAKLQQDGRYRVLLTRPADVFVPLGERVRIARAAGASLFISIHADTLGETSSVSGATVYTVSERASDSEAARVAASENQADSAAGAEKDEDKDDISDILADLTRRETRTLSHSLARSIVGYWSGVGHLNKNPQRAAGFVVLKAPDVPSVLLELGYLSNVEDAKSLTSADWRDKAATSVERSIDSFFVGRVPASPRAAPDGGPVAGLEGAVLRR